MPPPDTVAPSPAPLSAEFDRTGMPARDRSPPTPPSERAHPASPATADAGFEATEARPTAHIEPEHDPAATPPAPEDAGAGSAAQDLVRPGESGERGPVWDELADRAAHYATRARGAGTRRTYKSAWTHFSAWCRSLGREPLSGDADLIAMYVVRRADDGLTVSSIRVALAAIRTAHQLAGVALDLSH